MDATFIPVILAGGKGERFWPLSRLAKPKQFLSLDGSGKSLLQNTVARLPDWAGEVWVVTRMDLVPLVQEHCPHLPPERILGEPQPRDTAVAVAWVTQKLLQQYGASVIVGIFPADHWIPDAVQFQQTLAQAVAVCNALVSILAGHFCNSTGRGLAKPVGRTSANGDKNRVVILLYYPRSNKSLPPLLPKYPPARCPGD